MDALASLLVFREMTDTLSPTEFNTFKQTFCESIKREILLQIIFDGLNKKRDDRIINNTFQIVKNIIDSREPSKSTDDSSSISINLCDLSSSLIQYIGTHLTLSNLLNFERTNRFLAYSLRAPASIQSLVVEDESQCIVNKWLRYRVPFETSMKCISAKEKIKWNAFIEENQMESWMNNDLSRFRNVKELSFIINENDISSYIGLINKLYQEKFQESYNKPQCVVKCYLNYAVTKLPKLFTSVTCLDITFNLMVYREIIITPIHIIDNNSSTLQSITLRNHHPIQITTLFQNMEHESLPNLQHFSLIDINNEHPIVINPAFVYLWKRDQENDGYIDPFKSANKFLMHFLPNVCLSDYQIYPDHNDNMKQVSDAADLCDDDTVSIHSLMSKQSVLTAEDYYKRIKIPVSAQVAGYKYLTIDNSELVFDAFEPFERHKLQSKILKMFMNRKMAQSSFNQIRGICALNLNKRMNTYHLIETILSVHGNNIHSLHLHKVPIDLFNIKYKNVSELCCDFDLSRQINMDKMDGLNKLKRLHIVISNRINNLFECWSVIKKKKKETAISKLKESLIKIFNTNLSLNYLGINVYGYNLNNLMKILTNIFDDNRFRKKHELKIRINANYKPSKMEDIRFYDDSIIKTLFCKMEQISNKNCMLLFNLIGIPFIFHTDMKYYCNKYENFEWTHDENCELIFASFALSNANCKINGYNEHWKLNCKICDAK